MTGMVDQSHRSLASLREDVLAAGAGGLAVGAVSGLILSPVELVGPALGAVIGTVLGCAIGWFLHSRRNGGGLAG